jgi:hypothetical protein
MPYGFARVASAPNGHFTVSGDDQTLVWTFDSGAVSTYTVPEIESRSLTLHNVQWPAGFNWTLSKEDCTGVPNCPF